MIADGKTRELHIDYKEVVEDPDPKHAAIKTLVAVMIGMAIVITLTYHFKLY